MSQHEVAAAFSTEGLTCLGRYQDPGICPWPGGTSIHCDPGVFQGVAQFLQQPCGVWPLVRARSEPPTLLSSFQCTGGSAAPPLSPGGAHLCGPSHPVGQAGLLAFTGPLPAAARQPTTAWGEAPLTSLPH